MKIEVGKSYVTRDGDVVTIAMRDTGQWPFREADWHIKGIYYHSWDQYGFVVDSACPDGRDLMREVSTMPNFSQTGLLPENSSVRKDIPVTTGVLDYFPLAIMEIARLSKRGNDKHNPGQPLHWSRDKSNDHADCIGRHLLDRGRFAADGTRHSASLAWRALALLQLELEEEINNA